MRREGPGQSQGGASGPQVEFPTLVWEKPDGTQVDFPIAQTQPISLGREVGNTIVLDSNFVSKRHATVRYEGGQYIVEDLRSANGTRLNGAPVSISLLTPNDAIEVGDQTLRFVDRAGSGKKKGARGAAAPAGAGLGKLARLGGVALVFGGGLLMILRMLVLGGTAAPPPIETLESSNAARWTLADQEPAPLSTNTPSILKIVDQAKIAGINANDALFDEGRTQYTSGRVLEAARLFAAVVERDPSREIAKIRLGEVRNELESEVARHRAEAERMVSQLRYDDAASEWERVLLLLEPQDARVALAKAGLDAARGHARQVR
jgi:pSer/pThr/pTyr-binding forkhead associated (FHA) protein